MGIASSSVKLESPRTMLMNVDFIFSFGHFRRAVEPPIIIMSFGIRCDLVPFGSVARK